MKIHPVSGRACAVLLVAVGVMGNAHAQRSPWWERQKEASGTVSPAQGAVAPPPAQQAQPYVADVRREKIERPGYTYVEAGATRLDVDMYGANESGNGGYARGSAAVTDNLYVFGGYDRVSESGSAGTQHAKITIDQAEIGFGTNISLSPRSDFISELSWLRLGGRLDYSDSDYPADNFSGSDHLNAGKLMLGFRGRPSPRAEFWAKVGYVWVDDNLLIESSAAGNVGVQFRLTPVWGLVGEAELYEDLRFYRLGVRASF
ncbi:MAG: hypothetical protein QM599_10500 [Pseudoxanthomonas sp.]